ncbi:MAG: hypothetical protein RBR97_19240 [Bacteroidales bacterium]|nr:hypothetical protein [Bacteroidales bacterium]
MQKEKQILDKLNSFIEAENFNKSSFTETLNSFLALNDCKPIVTVIDFIFYNNELLSNSKKEQEIGIKTQNFEWVAFWRDKEKECLKFLNLKENLDIRQSIFLLLDKELLYFYIDSSKNDKYIKQIIAESYSSKG